MASTLEQFHQQFGSVMRAGIIEVFGLTNPLIKGGLLHFIAVDGFTYEYNREAALGGIAYRGLNETYTADIGVINPVIERITMFGGTVQTDAKLVEKRGGQYRASRVASKTKAAGLFYLQQFFDGDSGSNPKSMDGLNVRLTGNQVISTGGNGLAVTPAMVMDLQDRVYGDNNQKVLLMGIAQRRALSSAVVAAAGGAAVQQVALIESFNGSPIFVVYEDHNGADILGQDEAMGASNVTSSMYCVRFGGAIDEEWVQGLIGAKGFTAEDQGKIGTTFTDLLDIDAGLAVFHPKSAARLKGLL